MHLVCIHDEDCGGVTDKPKTATTIILHHVKQTIQDNFKVSE